MSEQVEYTEQVEQVDYFNFSQQHTYTFPDGRSYMTFEALNEGKKAKFQRETQRPVHLAKGGGASVTVDPASQRHELIKSSVTGWNLRRGSREIPFSLRELDDFLKLADPAIVDGLEKAIRKANKWLLDELSSEDIKKEIAELEEALAVAKEREAGEAGSVSK